MEKTHSSFQIGLKATSEDQSPELISEIIEDSSKNELNSFIEELMI